jgi:hypothetical protein
MAQHSILDKKYEDLIPIEMIKRHLWIDNDQNEDLLLREMLKCSIDAAEVFLRRCIVEQKVIYKCKYPKNGAINLPVAFAVEFISCQQDGQELQTPKSLMDNYDEKNNKCIVKETKSSAIVEIQYLAGWKDGTCPHEIIQGVLQHMYNTHHKQSPSLINNGDSIDLYQPYRRLTL